MAENGEEKLLAMARHIARTLGHTNNAIADNILQIFSNFDGRFSENLNGNLSGNNHGGAALDQTLKALERRISRYVNVHEPIWSNSSNAFSFLHAVDELMAVMRESRESDAYADGESVALCVDRAEDLLRRCMFRLEDEFKLLIGRGSVVSSTVGDGYVYSDSDEDDGFDELDVPVAHPVLDYNITIDALPYGVINDLHKISKRMVAAGYGKECSLAYSTCRRDFLEESLSRLGFSGLQNSTKPLIDDDNDIEIEKWIKAINMTVRVFYPSERRLCDRVFGYSSATAAAADLSFMDLCRISAMELLNFADGVAMGSRAPERVLKILDVYEAIKELLPEFEVLFSDQYCLFLKNEASLVSKKLTESIKGMFTELENLIRRDPAKSAVSGGGLHPITRYVINYLAAACSRPALKQVFDENLNQSSPSHSSSPLSVQIAWIIEVLESNLESKAKIYRDPALSSLFMMNNCRYMVKKVTDNELRSLLGDDWIRNKTLKVRQYQQNYRRFSWNKVITTLKLDNSHKSTLTSTVGSKSMNEKLKLFNSQFNEICRTQSAWVVFDEELRGELKVAVAGSLLPAYRKFLGRFCNVHDNGKLADKNVKVAVEDVEARIGDLFQATTVAGNGRR